jgi:hypothetical protein
MKNGHLTDDMIQEFVWNTDGLDASARTHVFSCNTCKARVENYQLLFNEIEQLPKPSFNFDLSTLVLNGIMEQNLIAGVHQEPLISAVPPVGKPKTGNRKNILVWIIVSLMAAGLIGTPVYLFQDLLRDYIAGVSVMVTYLIIMTILLIVAFLVSDEYRKYNQQINSLNI